MAEVHHRVPPFTGHESGLVRSQVQADRPRIFRQVAEFQLRGVVHFHAVIRLDGVGDGYPDCSLVVPDSVMQERLRSAVAGSSFDLLINELGTVRVAFGHQLDVREISAADADSEATPAKVAAYIAKYATKAAEDFGLRTSVRTAAAARLLGLSDHVVRIIAAAEDLGSRAGFHELRRWTHMLGFRGHFTTKSRSFLTTLTELRAERRRWRESRNGETARSGSWEFLGVGYLSQGDSLLAAGARADAAEDRWLARIDRD